MRLSYNPHAHRRCIACRPIAGQYALRAVIGRLPNGAVLLDCDHYDHSDETFRAMHPEWEWQP